MSSATGTHRVLVVGALGRMGENVRRALEDHSELRLGAALEAESHPRLGEELEDGVRVTADVKAALKDVDIVIDFSVPASTLTNIRAAADAGVAYVTGTTGFAPEEQQELDACANTIPLVQAANFSVAVNVLGWLTAEAARLLGDGFDGEIFELHHGAKRDAPSGTALFLGSQLAAGREQALADRQVLAREGDTGPREPGTIGIQTLRGGDNPGEHTVMFIGQGERVELAHRSSTRDHFARGAVRAAAWLVGRAPGKYDIAEVLGLGGQSDRRAR